MRKVFIIGIIVVLALGGLMAAMVRNAPQKPAPTTTEIWASRGVPVETAPVARGDIEQVIEVTGDISALDKATLSAKISGRVAQVNAREGDRVSRGQVIVVLDQQDLLTNLQNAQAGLDTAVARLSQAKTSQTVTKIQTDAAIEQAQAALQSANAGLAVAKNPSRSQERTVAENAVAEARAHLDRAEADYRRNQTLVKQGAISQAAFDVVESSYKIAQAQYRSATERLSLVKEGGRTEIVRQAEAAVAQAREGLRAAKANASQNLLRKEDVRQAQAGLAQARAGVALARQQLSYAFVRSPISGVLASRTTEPGQVIAAGQALGDVVNLGSLYLKGDVSETEVVNVTPGQQVRVSVDAIPNRTFAAVVEKVFPAAPTSNRNFPVRVRITGSDGAIRPGMFARGEIVAGMFRNVMLVPKDAVEERRGTKMVFSVGDSKARRVNVNVLRENSHYVQVAEPSGLKPGDIVVTEGRQNLQDGSKIATGKGK